MRCAPCLRLLLSQSRVSLGLVAENERNGHTLNMLDAKPLRFGTVQPLSQWLDDRLTFLFSEEGRGQRTFIIDLTGSYFARPSHDLAAMLDRPMAGELLRGLYEIALREGRMRGDSILLYRDAHWLGKVDPAASLLRELLLPAVA